jgi:hypothetical protein
MLRQMLHQPQKPRQVVWIDPLLIQRQDEVAVGGPQREIGVLNALGNAAKRDHGPEVIAKQEIGQRLVGNLSIDRHPAQPLSESSFRCGPI